MEKTCENCEYFMRMSMDIGKYHWGYCQKPGSGTKEMNGNKEGVFMWANKTCNDFKPRQESA